MHFSHLVLCDPLRPHPDPGAPLRVAGAVVGKGDAYVQTVQAIRTMTGALARLGLGLDHVVKTGVYLADMGQWEAVARAHREAFAEVRPACTWIECGTMIHPDMLVEIDAIAVE
jgi:enamine deaminase RidA (YjgF/YER057c/UK114 family)